MSNSVEDNLLSRIAGDSGRRRVIGRALEASLKLKAVMAAPSPTMTPYGKTVEILTPLLKKEIGPTFLRVQRQVKYIAAEVARKKTALAEKAKGKPIEMETVWAQKLLGMEPTKRAAYGFQNETARGVMLRNGELLDVDPTCYAQLLNHSISEKHTREAASLREDEDALNLARLSVDALQKTMLLVPVVSNCMSHFGVGDDSRSFNAPRPNEVRAFDGVAELNRWLAKEFPGMPAEAPLTEQVEADLVDEAA